MDFSTILTTFLNKISKPLPNLFIGGVFLYFSPENIKWFGYVFIAIGSSAAIEWGVVQLKKFQKNTDAKKKIIKKLSRLNHGERKILGKMVSDNEQTVSINYNDYHMHMSGGRNGQRGGRHEYNELFGICTGLQSKGLFNAVPLPEITSFSIFPEIWDIMQKLHQKDPNIFKAEEIE